MTGRRSEGRGGLGQLLLGRFPLRVELLQLLLAFAVRVHQRLGLREVVIEHRIRQLRLALLLRRLQLGDRLLQPGNLLLDGALHRAALLPRLGLHPLTVLLRHRLAQPCDLDRQPLLLLLVVQVIVQ